MIEWVLGMLFDFSAAVTGALLLLLLCRPWLRRRGGAVLLYASWTCVLVAPLAALPPAPRLPTPVAQVLAPMQVAMAERVTGVAKPSHAGSGLLLGVWTAGVLACWLSMAAAHLSFLRGLRRSGPLFRLGAGASAALVGCWPARVALPADFRQRYSWQERRLVLAHERVHAERGDNFWTLLAWLVLSLQWFNPLAWWALRRFRLDQELACDAAVLSRFPEQRASYVKALLKAQAMRTSALVSPCSRHPLIERISMLNQTPLRLRRSLVLGMALCVAAGGYAARSEPRAEVIPKGFVRVLMDIQVQGQVFSPQVHLAPAGEEREYPIRGGDGQNYLLKVSANPEAESRMIMVNVQLRNQKDGSIVNSPRMKITDGGIGRMVMQGKDGKHLMSADFIARSSSWEAAQAESEKLMLKPEQLMLKP